MFISSFHIHIKNNEYIRICLSKRYWSHEYKNNTLIFRFQTPIRDNKCYLNHVALVPSQAVRNFASLVDLFLFIACHFFGLGYYALSTFDKIFVQMKLYNTKGENNA